MTGPRELGAGLPESAQIPAASEAELQACVRDLMSLIALPAMTRRSDCREILERFCEALETLLPIQLCVATAPPFVEGAAIVSVLKVAGELLADQDARWQVFVNGCTDVHGSVPVVTTEDTPCGPLRIVKLAMGYGEESGSLVAGARRSDFPSLTESAVLRAAASLAAGCLKAARLVHEREEASRVKDEFLAMLGHELRNPLAPILTALALMKLRGDTKTVKEQQIIQRQADHLIRLVDDLMDVSRITRGKVELRTETVEISTVLMNALEMTSLLLEQRSHRLTVDVPPHGLLWNGDPTRLAQVVSNLLTNAARYTDMGGDIGVAAGRHGEAILISVKDNGSGIPAEMLPHVFDMFFQGKRTIERGEGGLGLGLALVKSLVQMHGGDVVAKSGGLGKGSEFVVRLPVTLDHMEAEFERPGRHTADSLPAATVPKRVLLVDDNADGADSLAQILTAEGHEVIVTYDPMTALKVCEEFVPDVAVLDIGLPVMDGYELALRLRELPTTRATHFIALTAYGRDHDVHKSKRAGFAEHLVKPVAPDQLLGLVAGATKT